MTEKCHLYVNHLNFARQLKSISLKIQLTAYRRERSVIQSY